MRVIVCGAGLVGWQIARHLSKENNHVTIVDSNAAMVRRATETLDVQGFCGFASHPDSLEQAGAYDADMIIAATNSDEVNMVVCQVSHSIFGINRKIARLRAQSYLKALNSDLYQSDHMPIDVVISPEIEVARAAMRRLNRTATFDSEEFLGGQVQLLGLQLTEECPILSTPLKQISDLFSTLRSRVVAVRRDGVLFVPNAKDQLFASDQIYTFTHSEDVGRTLDVLGQKNETSQRLIVVGGGNVALSLMKLLEASGQKLRVRNIELNKSRAEMVAEQLERTIVLNGDALNPAIMREAGVSKSDAVITLTDDDKTNILAAVQAQAMGAKRAITLINEPELLPLLQPLGLNAYINPRATTVSSILRHVRHGRVRDLYSIGDGEAEVIEAEILPRSQLAGRILRDIEFPESVFIGALHKTSGIVFPSGDTRIDAGDHLVLLAMQQDVERVDTMLQAPLEFF